MSNLVTGKVRFSYANVFEPRTTQSGEARYSVTILIPKTDVATKQKIDAEMTRVLQESISSTFGGVKPANPKIPIYDGDGLRPGGEPFGEECKGHWVMTANSKEAPEVVDANLNPILSKSEFYSGCYGRVSLRFFAYNKNGNKGVGCGLGNIQKLEDGESLTGKTTASQDFGQPMQPQPQPQTQGFGVNPITGQPINNIYGVN